MSLIGSLTSGVSALRSFEKGLDVIGNDIANVNSTGFKAGRTDYSDSFSNLLKQAAPSPANGGGSNTDAQQVGTGHNYEYGYGVIDVPALIGALEQEFGPGAGVTTARKTGRTGKGRKATAKKK